MVLTERPAGYGRSGEPRAAQSVGGAQEAPCQEPGDSETTDVEARGNLDADAWEWLVGCEEAAQRKAQAAERERGRDNMTVVLKHLRTTTRICYLRQHPHERSEGVQGGLLQCGQPVVLLTDMPTQDFVCVRATYVTDVGDEVSREGWLHVCWIGARYDGQEYKLLTESEWWKGEWTVSTAELGVWVRRNEDTEASLRDELALAGESDRRVAAARARPLEETKRCGHCTYIALSLGRPRQAEWKVCDLKCHVTVGYAAPMEAREREKLADILNDIVVGWTHMSPSVRPRRLSRFRQFQLQTEKQRDEERRSSLGWGGCRRGPVVQMSQETVDRYLREDLVYTPHLTNEETIESVVRRTWQRDGRELEAAEARVAGLSTDIAEKKTLRLPTASRGLGDSADIRDLLCYIGDAMLHFAACYRRDPQGKLVRPSITGEPFWHMSWQGGWARRDEQDARRGRSQGSSLMQ